MFLVNDLFSGIGGMALGLERTKGFKIVSFCEIDAFRSKVLKHHWPDVPIFERVQEIRGNLPRADWLIGGPPCHRTSIAAAIHGNWTGETLWPEMRRVIKETRPRGVIVEQPAKHKVWVKTVHRHLEELDYEVCPFLVEASDAGAIHSRERIFFVAHRYGKRLALSGEAGPSQVRKASRASVARGHWDEIDARVLRMDDGIPRRMDGLRKARIRAAGSSCVPHVAEALGRIILAGLA